MNAAPLTGDDLILGLIGGAFLQNPGLVAADFDSVRHMLTGLPEIVQLAFTGVADDLREHGKAKHARVAGRFNGKGDQIKQVLYQAIASSPPIEAIRAAIAAERRRRPRSVVDLLLAQEPEPVPIVEKLLFPGTCLVIGGAAKTGKTWAALQLSLSIASGTPFLGFNVPSPTRVLYLGGEGSDANLKKRINAGMPHIPGLEDDDLERIHIFSTLGRLKLDVPADLESIRRWAEDADVVVIDPYYRFLANGSENDHADQRAVQDALDGLKAAGKAIILVHHTRKPGPSDTGAGELRGAGLDGFADSILILSRKSEGSSSKFILKCTLRHDEEPDPLELTKTGPFFAPVNQDDWVVPPQLVADVVAEAGGRVEGKKTLVDLLRTEQPDASERSIHRAIQAADGTLIYSASRQGGRGQGRVYLLEKEASE